VTRALLAEAFGAMLAPPRYDPDPLSPRNILLVADSIARGLTAPSVAFAVALASSATDPIADAWARHDGDLMLGSLADTLGEDACLHGWHGPAGHATHVGHKHGRCAACAAWIRGACAPVTTARVLATYEQSRTR